MSPTPIAPNLVIFDALPVAIFVVNRALQVIYWNRQIERRLGQPRSNVLGHTLLECFQETDDLRDRLRIVVQRNTRTVLELQVKGEPDNPPMTCSAMALPVVDIEGNVGHILMYLADARPSAELTSCEFVDVPPSSLATAELERRLEMAGQALQREMTDRLLAEESLHDFRAMVENSPYAIARCRSDGQIKYVNGAYERLFGWTRTEACRMHYLDLHPPSAADQMHAAQRLCQQAGGYRGVVAARRRNERNPLLVDLSLVKTLDGDGRHSGFVIVAEDVSHRQHAVEELRKSQERFELAMRGANDGLWDWNLESDQIYYSSRWKSILGFTEAEISDHIREWTRRIHPADLEPTQREIRSHLSGHTPFLKVEHRLRAKDGSYRHILARGASIRDAKGMPYRLAGSITDITDLRRAQEEALLHRSELAHVLRQVTLGELESAIAHELNQPLASIVNFASGSTSRLRARKINRQEIGEALDQIKTQALLASEILRRIRTFVRKGNPAQEPVQLNHVVLEAVKMIEPESQKHGVSVHLELEPRLPLVGADAIQMEQVVLNLTLNAIDAMAESNGTVRSLRIETRRQGDSSVRVAVHDTGHGIPPEELGKVFYPFFTTKKGGLGMGLAISRSIIEAHRGELSVESTPGQGTTFWFSLECEAVSRDADSSDI